MRVRDAKKLASRTRVLDAARALFDEIGFENTTVRMIAQRAGLSPGGVFTTFSDKVAILSYLVAERRERVLGDLEILLDGHKGTARARLLEVFDMAFAADFPRMSLLASYHGAAYTWDQSIEVEYRRRNVRFAEMITGIIEDGVKSGEILAGIDTRVVVMMLYGFYRENCRTTVFDGLDEAGARGRMREQLNMLFQGLAPRA